MNGEVNPQQRMVYTWPLITNTRTGKIDALLDSKTYKTYITKVKTQQDVQRLKILTLDRRKKKLNWNLHVHSWS